MTPGAREATMDPKPKRMPPYYTPTYQGRPLQYVKDRKGNCWLCDKNVSPRNDTVKEACWRCEYLAFPLGGR
jgi:hypothetical protein